MSSHFPSSLSPTPSNHKLLPVYRFAYSDILYNGGKQYVVFSNCLISINMCLRFIHIVAWIRTLFLLIAES